MFEISTLEFEKLQSFMQKNPFELEAEIVLFGCFRVESEKNIFIFEISTLVFAIMQSFT